MPPLEILFPFIIASTLLALSPGPDNIFVLTQAALNGRLTGIIITLGLCTGLIFHTLAVAMGIATIFQHSALAFTGLKLVGVAYLLYLAWQVFRAEGSLPLTGESQKIAFVKYYTRGIVMNVSNPKVTIFFLAFLPQFARIENGSLFNQIIILGLVFIVVAFCVFGSIAFLAGCLRKLLSDSTKFQKILNKIAGCVFVLLAVNLVFVEKD